MTTKHSPIHVLRAQANRIAATLKAAERGDKVDTPLAARIAEARARGTFRVGIVMDDKVITLDVPWTTIAETDEAGIAEYVLRQMLEESDAPN